MRSYNKGPATIYLTDDGCYTVAKFSADGLGVTFVNPVNDVPTFVPWWRVKQVDFDAVVVPVYPAPVHEGETGQGDAAKDTEAREWPKATPTEMRAWAKANDIDVSESGPVSKDVAAKYAAAHAD